MKGQMISSVIVVFITSSCFSIALAETSLTTYMPQQAKLPAPVIRYDGGRLTVRIHKLTLGELLRTLGTVTGGKVSFSDPSIARQTMSVSVKAQPYAQGIREILDGFSYAIYPDEDSPFPAVTVLSTPRASGVKHAVAQNTNVEDGDSTHKNEENVLGSTTEDQGSEELIDRALGALEGDQPIEHDVLNQLVGAQDPRATEALVQAASRSSDGASRAQVVEALWRHAADHAFADEVAVASLEQLAIDRTPQVSKIARQALQDRKHFQRSNAAK